MSAILLLVALGAWIACRPVEAAAQGGPPARLNIYYAHTSGQVGHHLVAQPKAVCGGPWKFHWAGTELVRGTLPPGLQLKRPNIEGTPEQPGRWIVTIRLRRVECRGREYGEQDVPVEFNIKGTAPRRLN